MINLKKRARELAMQCFGAHPNTMDNMQREQFEADVAYCLAALREVRAEALERAATTVEQNCAASKDVSHASNGVREALVDIRALKGEE
jgi:hypothetical protein